MNAPHLHESFLDERSLSRLKWRCRRGLLENDLLIERFFRRCEDTLTTGQAEGLAVLMDLTDNDLLDLLLSRSEPQGETDTPQVREVLGLMRPQPHPHRHPHVPRADAGPRT